MVHRRTILQLLAVLVLLSLASCMRRGKSQTQNEATDFKDVLIVTLTDLLAQQTQKLSEANLEIEQLKMKLSSYESTTTGLIEDLRTEFSQQIEDQTSKCTQQIEDLTHEIEAQNTTFSQQIEAQNTTFSQQIEDQTSNYTQQIEDLTQEIEAQNTTFSQQIEGLTSKSTKEVETLTTGFSQQIEALKDTLAGSESNTTTKLGELKDEVARAENSTTEKIEEIRNNVTMVTSGVADLVSKVSEVENVAGTWPEGAYCILGSGGSCPTGFTRYQGFVKRIYSHSAADSRYMKQVRFGDSRMGCYNSDCRERDSSKANIEITACCK